MTDDLADARLEREITAAKTAYDAAIGDPAALRAAWLTLAALVNRRSDAQVERMERQRGLR